MNTDKKYILIQNDGEIETNSFELIGASTKRGEVGKIGFFGSGLKYSIAYMMRQGIDFKVFSGETELKFSTIPETLKDKTFERICINGKPTSYTTTAEKTRIYIELTAELQKVVNRWDSYFSDERTPLFVANNIYTCYLGHEDVTPLNTQEVYVYPKTDGVLFRMGIRIYRHKEYLFDYGFKSVNINEDRTAKNSSGFAYGVAEMAAMLVDENWLKTVLRTAKDEKESYEYGSLTVNGSDGIASQKWIEFSKRNMLVVDEIAGRYAEEISKSKKEVFHLPGTFARRIKKSHPDVLIVGMGNAVDDTFASDVEVSPKMKFLLKEVLSSLKDMSYHVEYPIKVVEFMEDTVLGAANMEGKEIMLASKVFDMGRREIALTIMEENEHIKSQKTDETRAFQTHIFSQWLTSMENQNGLFL